MLDRVHKIADIVAAFAIVASLLFLGAQISQNTLAVDTQADDAIWSQWTGLNSLIASSPGLAEIITRGDQDPDTLKADELLRYENALAYLFNTMELTYRVSIRAGEEESSEPAMFVIQQNMVKPGVVAYWEKEKQAYQAEFVKWVDKGILDEVR